MVRGKGVDEPRPNAALTWPGTWPRAVSSAEVAKVREALMSWTVWFRIPGVSFETLTKRPISKPIDITCNAMTAATMTWYLGKPAVKSATNASAPPKARTGSPEVAADFTMSIVPN